MRKRWIWMAPLAIVGTTAFIALGGVAVMQLWNWLLPLLFGWRLITFWQAVGILALSRILFGGLGCHRGAHSGFRRRKWMEDRCRNMTPEDRERFRQGIREGWAFGPPTGESKQG